MTRFRFNWNSGPPDEAEAETCAEAFAKLGYAYGALRALDHWSVVPEVAARASPREEQA